MKILFLFIGLSIGCFSCKKKNSEAPSPPQPFIGILNCPAAIASATPVAGAAYTGTISVPYTGGNGASYTAGTTINSTGVTGLTATLQAGTLANGSGNLVYNISGTPSTNGTASFPVFFAGRSCSIALAVGETAVVQYGTPFTGVPDRRDAIIYQVNMRAFSSGSNFQGVIARLDSIKSLGVNVIYLMPIYPIGTVNSVNSPYSIKDYKGVNPEFGTLNDLRSLVDGAHSKNMSVILDWVANHTAWDHPWISSHSDWYQKNGTGAIVSPPGTGWNDVAQLNFSNGAMRLQMIRDMKYWVYAANVDGFRFDYADGPPFDFWKQAIDTLRNITSHKLLLLAEGSRNDHFTAGFDFTFGFNFYGSIKNIFGNNQPATSLDALNQSEYLNASNGQQVVRYITNHDVNSSDGTPLELFGGPEGSIAAFIIASYMKGVPMIYNGQEVGTPFRLLFPFTGADINWSLNPHMAAEYKKLDSIRNASAAIRRGTLNSYSSADVCAFVKQQGAETVFVAVNVRNSAVNYTFPSAVANGNWTNSMTGTPLTTGTQISLQPFSYLILNK